MSILGELDLPDGTTLWVRSAEDALAEHHRELSAHFEGSLYDLGIDPSFPSETGLRSISVFEADSTPPLGIYSVGAIRWHERWWPGLLVMRPLAPDTSFDEPWPARELSWIYPSLAEVAGPPPDELWVVGIDPPDEFVQKVRGTQQGTLGIPVRLPDGSSGALTAGHVAQSVGSTVQVGTADAIVTYSSHRHLHQTWEVRCADVAVLQFDTSVMQPPSVSGLGTVKQMQRVSALNTSGEGNPGGKPLRFAGTAFPVREDEGSWGDFLMVDPPISRSGDSGSIALNEQDEVVGHVVGGKLGAYSIVQGISYQLSEAGVTFDRDTTQ